MTLEDWRKDPEQGIALGKLLASGPLAQAITLAKDRANPSGTDIAASNGADHVAFAAIRHSTQAGWHDCLRFIISLSLPVKEGVRLKSLEQWNDEYVRSEMAKLGKNLPEPETKPKTKRK